MKPKIVLFLVHGIWRLPFTRGWQSDVIRVAKEMGLLEDIIIQKINYPFIPAIASWLSTFMPPVYKLLSYPFNKGLELNMQFYAHHPKAVIAHSYGTWLLWRKMLFDERIKFDTVIFTGSPCPHTPIRLFTKKLMPRQIKRWINYANFRDKVAGKYSPRPYGDLGQIGLQPSPGKLLRCPRPLQNVDFQNIYVHEYTQSQHHEYFTDKNIEDMLRKVIL